uniref:Uncharacterized protein n=1 Tax=Cucumis melo TaxID=3656 RepID=A0A9I9EM82_CUCME
MRLSSYDLFLKHGIVTQTETLNCDNHLKSKSMHIIFQKILLLSQQWSQLLDEQQRTQPKKKKKSKDGHLDLRCIAEKYVLFISQSLKGQVMSSSTHE